VPVVLVPLLVPDDVPLPEVVVPVVLPEEPVELALVVVVELAVVLVVPVVEVVMPVPEVLVPVPPLEVVHPAVRKTTTPIAASCTRILFLPTASEPRPLRSCGRRNHCGWISAWNSGAW
jgi:hypothetical protein